MTPKLKLLARGLSDSFEGDPKSTTRRCQYLKKEMKMNNGLTVPILAFIESTTQIVEFELFTWHLDSDVALVCRLRQ